MSLGPGEIFIVLVVALLVLGPEKLPGAARQTGKLIREFKRMSTDLTNQFHAAMDEVDPTKENKKPRPAGSGDTISTDLQEDSSATDRPHPGTEGFELIDKKAPGEPGPPLAKPDPEAPAPGAPPGPTDPSAVQPVEPWIPDSPEFEPPPDDQTPADRPAHRKGASRNDPLSRYSNDSDEADD